MLAGAGLLLALSFVLAACGGASGSEGSGGNLSGSINVEGSSTVQPITQVAAELFGQEYPDVKFKIGGAGTSDGFEAFCQGDTQVSDASRPIDPAEEVPICKENKIEYIELPIAYDGISIVVNAQNDWAQDITTEELKMLWEPAAEDEITRWSQVRPSWPDRPISLYGPGTESGTFEFFTEEVVGEEEASRTDYEASENDNVLVRGVSGDENALGYFGFSYYENNKDTLKALALDGVKPTTKAIQTGEYSLSRPLFIYVNAQDLEKNKALQEFVSFYISEQNLTSIVENAKYVPLPGSLAQETRAQFEDRTSGTVYTAEGEPKGGDLESALEQSQ
jgi:phosphate transport system substrate-binding protein